MFFAQHPGEVLSRDLILSAVWPHAYVTDSVLQSAVSTLRKAFGDAPRQSRFLETIPKRGYRLLADSAARRRVLAVLPFENLTGDAEQGWLADGITDGLTHSLGLRAEFKVISRSSIRAMDNTRHTPNELAQILDVDFVLEGTLTRAETRWVLRARLADTADNSYVWSATEDIDLDDLFAAEERLARGVCAHLLANPADDEEEGPLSEPVVPNETVEDYLRGRFYWNKLDHTYFSRALACFQNAAARSPTFAPAYVGIADVWGAYGYWGKKPVAQVSAQIDEAVSLAKAADPHNPEVLAIEAAYAFHYEWRWAKARGLLEDALRLNPSYAHAHLLMALLLGTLGDPTALDTIERARRLDPLSAPPAFAQVMCLCGQARYAEAMQCVDRLLELHPDFPPGWEIKAELLWQLDERQACLIEARLWAHDEEISKVLGGSSYDRTRLLDVVQVLQDRQAYTSPRMTARLCSLGGAPAAALDIIRAAVGEKDLLQVDFVAMNPAFAAMRELPGYAQLSKAIGITERNLIKS